MIWIEPKYVFFTENRKLHERKHVCVRVCVHET